MVSLHLITFFMDIYFQLLLYHFTSGVKLPQFNYL